MIENNINFKEEVIVSVHEQRRNKKLELFSLVIIGLTFFLAVTFFGIGLVFTSQLNDLKNIEQNLIAQIIQPENKKKETLYFLIKNRLEKLFLIQKLRIKEGEYFSQIIKINDLLKIDNLELLGKTCELTIQTDDHRKFDSFLKNADDYGIVRDGIVVSNTSFQKGTYRIALKFTFK